MTTPPDLLRVQLRRDGARPLLTWYDDVTAERIELSVATAANWAAKTANLLADEYALGAGDSVTLAPATHWLSVVVVLGAWTAGVTVDLTGDGADLTLPGDGSAFMRAALPQPDALLAPPSTASDIGLVTTTRSWSLGELVEVAGAPPTQCRVLTTLALDTLDGIRAAIVVPLVAGGSSVLVTNADADRLAQRASSERVTHTEGVELVGIPRLASE